MKPSTAKVYALLKSAGESGVSPDDARRLVGTDRLAARVAELRAEGHDIETTYQTARGATFARYVLREPRSEQIPEGEMRLLWGSR